MAQKRYGKQYLHSSKLTLPSPQEILISFSKCDDKLEKNDDFTKENYF